MINLLSLVILSNVLERDTNPTCAPKTATGQHLAEILPITRHHLALMPTVSGSGNRSSANSLPPTSSSPYAVNVHAMPTKRPAYAFRLPALQQAVLLTLHAQGGRCDKLHPLMDSVALPVHKRKSQRRLAQYLNIFHPRRLHLLTV